MAIKAREKNKIDEFKKEINRHKIYIKEKKAMIVLVYILEANKYG